MSQPYVDGITDTVTHNLASSLTAGQITAGQDMLIISVVCPDRWFFGDFAVVTGRDGRAFVGEVEAMDVCTGQVTIRGAGHMSARTIPLPGLREPGQRRGVPRHWHISVYPAGHRGRLARVADAWPRQAATGRLGQVCDRWIYSACLRFGLDLQEQERSGFRHGYPVYQAEYPRNLLFASGAQMEALFDRVLDRTRSRLDIPAIRTLFGLQTRPHRTRKDGPPAQEIVIEKPRYGLSWFRISFGRLQLKASTKGEHVLRFEATVHNAQELRCRRSLDNFDQISTMLATMADRFATALGCADTGILPDGLLDLWDSALTG